MEATSHTAAEELENILHKARLYTLPETHVPKLLFRFILNVVLKIVDWWTLAYQ